MRLFILFILSTILFSSCAIFYEFHIPYHQLVQPQLAKERTYSSDTYYLITYYNFSATHESGDTIVFSRDPVSKTMMYHIEDLHTEFEKYLQKFDKKLKIVRAEQSLNGPYLYKAAETIMDSLKSLDASNKKKDSTFIYWFTNLNGTREYDGTPYGSLNDYNYHEDATSYVLVVNNNSIIFYNAVRTFARYGSSWKFYRKSVSRLFDPYFNPDAVKRLKSPPKITEVID